MSTPQDNANTTGRPPRPSGSPPDEPRLAPGAGGQGAMPPRGMWLWFALILLANFLLFRFLFPGPEAPVEVPYTFFKEEVRAGNVEAIYSQGDTVEGRFEEPVTYPPKGEGGSEPSRTSRTFTTVLPSFVAPGLEELLISNGVEISAEPIQDGGGLWQTLLFAFGPALLLIGGYIWLYRRAQQQGGGMGGALTSVGRSRARRYDQEQDTRVTFEDVAGIEEAENELVEIVDFFKQARENAPAIIFIDELDSIGRSRGQTAIGGSSEQEQTLNQILTEMDGFSSKEGVIVLAATNQPDALEKIVLGPERPLLLTPEERERIAYHEGGHAILGLVVTGADPVNRVTIVPRGQALGVTYQRPEEDRYN